MMLWITFLALLPVSIGNLMPRTELVSGAGPKQPLPEGFCNEEEKVPTKTGYKYLQWKFDGVRQSSGKTQMSSGGYGCACAGEYTYNHYLKYGTLYCKFSPPTKPDFMYIFRDGTNFTLTREVGNITVYLNGTTISWDTILGPVTVSHYPKSVLDELNEFLQSLQKYLST